MKLTNMLKKSATVLMAGAILFSTTACSSSSADSDVLDIGIVQLADNGAFDDMREGFIAQMRSLGYDEEEMTFDYENAQGDMTTLNTIAQSMVDDGKDAVVAIATPAAQAMVNLESEIPVFYISVSDPIAAGVITTVDSPDKNATGTSNAIPVEEMFKLADSLTPGCTTYGLIYCTSEVNSVSTIESAKAYLEANGLSYKEAVVTASSEVQQAAQSLVGSVDAIFCPNDSMVQSAMAQVAEVAKEAQIPVYGSSAVMVASGAFATISIDDTTIGAMTADMLAEYLGGTAITQIPAITVDTFTTVINSTTADAIGVTVAEDVLATASILE